MSHARIVELEDRSNQTEAFESELKMYVSFSMRCFLFVARKFTLPFLTYFFFFFFSISTTHLSRLRRTLNKTEEKLEEMTAERNVLKERLQEELYVK